MMDTGILLKHGQPPSVELKWRRRVTYQRMKANESIPPICLFPAGITNVFLN